MARPKGKMAGRLGDATVLRLAARLRVVREERGLTQSELATRSKCAQTYVSKVEQGTLSPGVDMVGRLAAALGTTAADLLLEDPVDELPALAGRAGELLAEIAGHA